MIIAIDGPSASGKSSVAKKLAKELGFTYIDSGAMYRAVSYYMQKHGIENEEDVKKSLEKLSFHVEPDCIEVDQEFLTDELRTEQVDRSVSYYSALLSVRNFLNKILQETSESKDVIMDGRDIGTVVFPDADLKFFMIASADTRARRRLGDRPDSDYEVILEDIKRRDFYDSNRLHAPLKKAEDAIEIDTDHLSIDDVVETMKGYVHEKHR